MLTALQIRGSQRKITTNLRPLAAHIYHVIIIVTGRFSKKSFLLLFPRNCFEQRTCFHGIETLLQNSQNKFFLFICSFFYVVSLSFCALTLATFSYFATAFKHIGWVRSLYCCCFAIILYVTLSTLYVTLSNYCTFCITNGTKEKTKSINLTSYTFH